VQLLLKGIFILTRFTFQILVHMCKMHVWSFMIVFN